jgi:multisubunit Na+/H+ antiporter MnhB subunit
MRVRRQGRVAVAVIWLLVLVGTFVVGATTDDPGGAGELGAAFGIALTSLYFFLRRARSWEDLIPPTSDAPVGSATAAWVRVVVMILLWVAGSVILILLRVPDGYAVILGWLLPLAAFLAYRQRRSAGHP